MQLRINNPRGMIPGRSSRALPDGMAQLSQNCKLESGACKSFTNSLKVNKPTKVGTKKSIYRYKSRLDKDSNGSITGATKANPVVISSTGHNLTTGDRVYIDDVVGMTEINALTFTVTVIDPDTYSLDGENGTTYGTYTSGGTWVKENGYWFHWVNDVDVVRSAIAIDTNERTIWTGDGSYPKVTDDTIAITGGTDYPIGNYRLGLPIPADKPVVRGQNSEIAITDITETRMMRIIDGKEIKGPDHYVEAVDHGLRDGEQITINGVLGVDHLNGESWTVEIESGAILNAQQTNPVKIKADADLPLTGDGAVALGAMNDGDRITLSDVVGMTEINGTHNIQFITGTITNVVQTNEGGAVYNPDYRWTVTSAGHGLETGDRVKIRELIVQNTFSGVVYTNVIEPVLEIEKLDANTFKAKAYSWLLQGGTVISYGSWVNLREFELNGVDGTGYTAYKHGGEWRHPDRFKLVDTAGVGNFVTITAMSKTGGQPYSVTAPFHDLVTGERIKMYGASAGTIFASGSYLFDEYVVTVVDGDTFTLDGTSSETATPYLFLNPHFTKAYNGSGHFTRHYDPGELITKSYVYTYVSAWGEEGPPSEVSALVELGQNQNVVIEGMSAAPTGAYSVTKKRIYRSETGGSETDFFFVAEIDVALTTYTDNVEVALLGEILASEDWIQPPADMHSIVAMDNGMIAGASGNDVYFCESNLPHAWPEAYRKSVNSPITAQGSFANTLVVLTETSVVLMTGNDPSTISERDLQLNQVCVSKRSVVSMGEFGVVYASPDGLMTVGVGGAKLVTESHFTRDEWQYFKPESIHAYFHDGRYYAFYDNGTTQAGFIFDPRRPEYGVTYIDVYATAGYADPVTDTLYLQIGDYIQGWERGSSKMTYTWQSKEYDLPRETQLSAIRVIADTYNSMTVKIYQWVRQSGNELVKTLVGTVNPVNDHPIRFKPVRADRIEIEISGTDTWHDIQIAETTSEFSRAA